MPMMATGARGVFPIADVILTQPRPEVGRKAYAALVDTASMVVIMIVYNLLTIEIFGTNALLLTCLFLGE